MLPPGPRSGLLALVDYVRDPYGSTMRLFERYGDPCTIRSLGTIVSTANPELVRAIFAADPSTFVAFGVDLLAPIMGHESLIMLSGDKHRAARKLLTPPFHGARMRSYGATMQTIARAEARRWRPGTPFAINRATQSISLRVILGAVFGVSDAAWEKALVDTIEAVTPSVTLTKVLRHSFGGIGPWARLQRRIRVMEEMLYADIAARRAAPRQREDILALIMSARYDDGSAMSDRQLYETLMTIVAAGHETTAISTAWAAYFVHRHPEVRERLYAEIGDIRDPEAIVALPYLEAVCHETLRLHPVAGSVARTLARPFELGGYTLPAGVAVSPSVTALHRRPELYPSPETFRPERFLERSFAPWEYIPFGGGHRRCIGAAFALYEMKIVLAAMLERPLELVDKKPIPARPRSTVIGPKRDILFKLAPS